MKLCKDKGGSDKWLHFIVIIAIGAVLSGLLSMAKFLAPVACAAIVFAVCAGLGVYKEIRDGKAEGNHFCVWDLACDLAAAVLIAAVAYAANYFTWH